MLFCDSSIIKAVCRPFEIYFALNRIRTSEQKYNFCMWFSNLKTSTNVHRGDIKNKTDLYITSLSP